MDTTTDREIHRIVTETLADQADQYDIEAITADLIAQHGRAREYDDALFWAIVADHALDPTDPGDRFRTDLSTAIAAAPAGEPATWTDGRVTVTVHGASRVQHAWPQVTAEVTITAPDGSVDELDGQDVESWTALWGQVQTAAQGWADSSDQVLDLTADAHRRLTRAEQALTRARAERDTLVREASATGLSAYRIAKRLGVAESTIGRIIAR